MFLFNHSISTCNNPFARLLVRTGNGVRKPGQRSGVANNFESRSSLSLLASKRHRGEFGIRHDPSTAATLATARRLFSNTLTKTQNSSSSGSSELLPPLPLPSPSSPSMPLPTTILSDKQVPRRVPTRNSPVYWTIEENTKMLELIRDNIKSCKMTPYFPRVSTNAVFKHAAYLRERLTAIGATASNLNDPSIFQTMSSLLKQPQRWSKAQTDLLKTLYKQHGTNWDLLANLVSKEQGVGEEGEKDLPRGLFPKRTANQCRNRIGTLDIGLNRGGWSKEELERFWAAFEELKADYQPRSLKAVDGDDDGDYEESDGGDNKGGAKFAAGFWRSVAEKVQTRNSAQCCRYYSRPIKPTAEEKKDGPVITYWTVEELEALRDINFSKSIAREFGDVHRDQGDDILDHNNQKADKNYTEVSKERKRESLKLLLKTRSRKGISQKTDRIRDQAKLHSISAAAYLELLIENSHQLGMSDRLKKEREELIAEKLKNIEAVEKK